MSLSSERSNNPHSSSRGRRSEKSPIGRTKQGQDEKSGRRRHQNVKINIQVPQRTLKMTSPSQPAAGETGAEFSKELQLANDKFQELLRETLRNFQLDGVKMTSEELQERRKKLMKMISLAAVTEVSGEQHSSSLSRQVTLDKVVTYVSDSLRTPSGLDVEVIMAELAQKPDFSLDLFNFIRQNSVQEVNQDETPLVPEQKKSAKRMNSQNLLPNILDQISDSSSGTTDPLKNAEPAVDVSVFQNDKSRQKPPSKNIPQSRRTPKSQKARENNSEVGRQEDFFNDGKSLTSGRRSNPPLHKKTSSMKSSKSLHIKENVQGSARSILVTNNNQDLVVLGLGDGDDVGGGNSEIGGTRNKSVATVRQSHTESFVGQPMDYHPLKGQNVLVTSQGMATSVKNGKTGENELVTDSSMKIVSSTVAKSALLAEQDRSQHEGLMTGNTEITINRELQHHQGEVSKPPIATTTVRSARKQPSKRQKLINPSTPLQPSRQQSTTAKPQPFSFGKTPVISNKAESFTKRLQQIKTATPRAPMPNARGANKEGSLAADFQIGQLSLQAQGFAPLTMTNFHSSSKGAIFKQPKTMTNFNKEANATSSSLMNKEGIAGRGLIGKNQPGKTKQLSSHVSQGGGGGPRKNSFHGQFRAGKIKKSQRTLHQTAPLSPLKGNNDTNVDINGKQVATQQGAPTSTNKPHDARDPSPYALDSALHVHGDLQRQRRHQEQRSKSDFSEPTKSQPAQALPKMANSCCSSPGIKTKVHLNIKTPPTEQFQYENARNGPKFKDSTVSLFKDAKVEYGNGMVARVGSASQEQFIRCKLDKIETQLLSSRPSDNQLNQHHQQLGDVSNAEALAKQIGLGLGSPFHQVQTQDGAEAVYLVVVDSQDRQKESQKPLSQTLQRERETDALLKAEHSSTTNHEVLQSRIQDKSYGNEKQSMVESSIININSVQTREGGSQERPTHMFAEKVLVTQSSKRTLGQQESTESLAPFTEAKMEMVTDKHIFTANSVNRSSNEGFGSIVKRLEKTKHLNLSGHLTTDNCGDGGVRSDEQRYEKHNVNNQASDDVKMMTERPNQMHTLKSKGDESSVTGTNPIAAHLMSGRYSNRESANMVKAVAESVNQSISFGAANLPYQSSALVLREANFSATDKASVEQHKQPKAQHQFDANTKGEDNNVEPSRAHSTVSLFKNSQYQQHSSVAVSKESPSPIRKFDAVPTLTSDESPLLDQKRRQQQQERKEDIEIEVVDQNSQIRPILTATKLHHDSSSMSPSGSVNINLKQSVHWNQRRQVMPPSSSKAHDDSTAEREYGYIKDVKQFDSVPPSTGHPSSLRDTEQVLKYKKGGEKSITPKSSEEQTMIKMPSEPALTPGTNYKELFSEKDPAILEERLKSILVSKNKFFSVPQSNHHGGGSLHTTMLPELSQAPLHPQSVSIAQEDQYQTRSSAAPNVFDHNIKRQGGVSDRSLSIQAKQSHNLHSVISSGRHSRKPATASGKFISSQQFPSSILSTIAHQNEKRDSFLEVAAAKPTFGKTQVCFGKKALKSTTHGSVLNKMPATIGTESVPSKNRIATAISEVQRQIRSGQKKMTQSHPTFPVDDNSTKLDITGKNHLRNFKSEMIQIKLIKQLKIIMDKKSRQLQLMNASVNLIQILFGERYRPDEAETALLCRFIQNNPQLSVENLVRISLQEQARQQMDQSSRKQSQHPGNNQRSIAQTKVGFGRTISEVGGKNGRHGASLDTPSFSKYASTTPAGGPSAEGKASARKKSPPDSKEQSVMALNTIARRMFLQRQHKEKKTMEDENLEFYENKEHQSLVRQLRQTWRANLFNGSDQQGAASRTPQSNLSQCSTFDNMSPLRGTSPEGGFGSKTYVTQMAKVDMDLKKKRDNIGLDLSHNRRVHSQSELKIHKPTPNPKPPLPTGLSGAGKLSQLLNTANGKGTGIDAYIKQKREKAFGHQLKALTKNQLKANIAKRLVPKEKAKLTEAIHQYIAAHQLKSTADVAHNSAGSAFHQNNQVGGGAFSLITGQSEDIKAQYTAVSMYPKEKVNQLLKYRDDIRQQARDSSQISGDKYHLYSRGYSMDAPKREIDSNVHQLFENKALLEQSEEQDAQKERMRIMGQFHTIEKIKQFETGSWSMVPKKIAGLKNHTQSHQQLLPVLEAPHSGQVQPLVTNEDRAGAQKEVKLTQHYERIEREMNQVPSMKFKKKELLLEKIILDRALDKVQKRRFIRSNMP